MVKRRRLDEKLRRAFARQRPESEGGTRAGEGAAPPLDAGRSGPGSAPAKHCDAESNASDLARSGLRKFLQRRHQKTVEARDLAAAATLPAGGAQATNDRGTFWLRRLEYPLAQQHGGLDLQVGRRPNWATLATRAKDPAVADVRATDCLFLDTETTGLAGGAGTVVFMTGIGFFEAEQFVVEQAFMRRFSEEPAALAHIARRLSERPVQVTFVGKSFDRHRLHARMTVHRVEAPVLDPLHLDLYHLARRVWGGDLPDCRLQTLERTVLGLDRPDDLPGSEAPQAFLDFVQRGTGPIERVFEHNRLDVLTLVTLLGVLGQKAPHAD